MENSTLCSEFSYEIKQFEKDAIEGLKNLYSLYEKNPEFDVDTYLINFIEETKIMFESTQRNPEESEEEPKEQEETINDFMDVDSPEFLNSYQTSY